MLVKIKIDLYVWLVGLFFWIFIMYRIIIILSGKPSNSHLIACTFPLFGKAKSATQKDTVTNKELLGTSP